MLFRRKDDSGEFERLMRPHLARLYRLACHFTECKEDAEDLIQDLLIKVYLRRKDLAGLDDLNTWLAKVLYRMSVDLWRRRSSMPVNLYDSCYAHDPMDALAGDGKSPQEAAESAQGAERLQWALGRLGEDHRILVVMHDVEGYTLYQLQAVMDLPLGTLKSRLHRARRRLKHLLRGGSSDRLPRQIRRGA